MLKHRDRRSDAARRQKPGRRFAVARRGALAASRRLRVAPPRDCSTFLASAPLRAILTTSGIEYGP